MATPRKPGVFEAFVPINLRCAWILPAIRCEPNMHAIQYLPEFLDKPKDSASSTVTAVTCLGDHVV